MTDVVFDSDDGKAISTPPSVTKLERDETLECSDGQDDVKDVESNELEEDLASIDASMGWCPLPEVKLASWEPENEKQWTVSFLGLFRLERVFVEFVVPAIATKPLPHAFLFDPFSDRRIEDCYEELAHQHSQPTLRIRRLAFMVRYRSKDPADARPRSRSIPIP